MNFNDFENKQDLIGKRVLNEYGQSYDRNKSRTITTITKVTKTGFRINRKDDALYDFNGHRKGLNSRQYIATVDTCTLLTDEEAKQIAEQWKAKRQVNAAKKFLLENMNNFPDETIMKLYELCTKIKGEKYENV